MHYVYPIIGFGSHTVTVTSAWNQGRILNAECTDFATAPETILRADGCGFDLGYTVSVQLEEKRVLIVY